MPTTQPTDGHSWATPSTPTTRGHPPGTPRVAIESWSLETALGGYLGTWKRLLDGDVIRCHTRASNLGDRGRSLALARRVTRPLVGVGFHRDAAVIVGTSTGSIEDWLNPPPTRPETPTSHNLTGGLSPCGLGEIAAALARECRTCGPVLTVSAACASGLHALIRGTMLIRSGEVRQAIVVATEASVHPLFLGSFQRLGVLAKPGEDCRPFDRNRASFHMSEAAAAVLLEAVELDGSLPSRRAALRRRAHRWYPPVLLDGFAMGGGATHPTGGDPDARVLWRLLARVLDDRPVDLIHAHGTGTELDDVTELVAIESAVSAGWPRPPVVYSHKGALGHSLGASGLLSVVLNCMSHTSGTIPPNVQTTQPLPVSRVAIPPTVTTRRVSRSVAIAAGFGGPVAVVGLASARCRDCP